MRNYYNFEKQCQEALDNKEISRRDKFVLTKIAKAIAEKDSYIKMELNPHYFMTTHQIKCSCVGVENYQSKIKKALEEEYFLYGNFSDGWGECSISIDAEHIPQSTSKILSDYTDKKLNQKIGEKRKKSCQFANQIDMIVSLVEKGKYEKADGIIQFLITHINQDKLLSEEDMLDDLRTVINGISEDENGYIQYSDDVEKIANKYNVSKETIKSVLEIKIRCFDVNYLCNNRFFDIMTDDYEIIERKLANESYDDVEKSKLLYEIDLSNL